MESQNSRPVKEIYINLSNIRAAISAAKGYEGQNAWVKRSKDQIAEAQGGDNAGV